MVICRGQFAASIRFLAKRWQWGERKVRCFLAYLKKQDMITSECSQGINLITILDYDGYSGNASWDTTKDTTWDTAKDTTITQSISDLQNLETQQKTQPRTQVGTQPSKITEKGQNLGHSRDTKLNKEESINNLSNLSKEIKENTPYGVSKKKEKEEADVTLKTSENTPSPSSAPPPSPKRFVKPTVNEIRAYCTERRNNVDAEYFYDYYESNGWKVGGRGAMKDWRAAVRTWEKNNGKYTSYGREKQQRFGATPPDDFAGKGSTKL